MRNKSVCVIEFAQGALRVTAVNARMSHVSIPYVSGKEQDAAGSLSAFVRAHPCRCIVALSPRAACLMGTFRLPSQDAAELLNMTQFQFSRTTPHKRQDMLVDVKLLEKPSHHQSVVAGAMMVKDKLMPFLDILKQAGLDPDVVTVNTQRLFPLAKSIWSNSLNGDGKVLGLCLDGTVSLGFFARGDLLFSREEGHISDSALGAFMEYCHKEFPSIAIKECILLGRPDEAGMSRFLAGVPVNVAQLASYVRTTQEQSAFELAPVAFLDLLLSQDESAKGFDFSPEDVKAQRSFLKMKSMAIHAVVIMALLAAGFIVRISSDFHRKTASVDALSAAINRASVRVKALEEKSRVVAAVEAHMASRVLVSSAMASLSEILPLGAHVTEVEFKDGSLSMHGEADDLETARNFQNALQSSPMFHNVRLEGIDKRPTEKAQVVMFRMHMKVAHD